VHALEAGDSSYSEDAQTADLISQLLHRELSTMIRERFSTPAH
jgi:hypothetical protein